MQVNILYLALVLFILLGSAITALIYYRFYKKYDGLLREILNLLQQKSFIKNDDYQLYDYLGVAGFGLRMSLLKKIMAGKRFQIAKGRWIEPKANEFLLNNFNLAWVRSFYKLINVITTLFVMAMGLAIFF